MKKTPIVVVRWVPALILILQLHVAYAAACSAQWCDSEEVAKLLAADGMTEARFGFSVAASGDLAVVGAPTDSELGVEAGAVYVYRFDKGIWVQDAKLLASDGSPFDSFGGSVSVSGDVVVVGAIGDSQNGLLTGAAYVFRRTATGWIQEAKWLPDTGYATTGFGVAVAVDDDVALVAVPNDNGPTTNTGVAYVFTYDGSKWSQTTKLETVFDTDYAHAISSVAISGDVAVLGFMSDNYITFRSGSAYVFRRDGSKWTQEARLVNKQGGPSDSFGNSVSASGDAILVGTNEGVHGQYSGSGAAYAFRYADGQWRLETRLNPSDNQQRDYAGWSVSLDGDTALIGSWGNGHDGMVSGAAYLYQYDGSMWLESEKLLAGDRQPSDSFGFSVALSGSRAVIGARNEDSLGINAGAAYLFDVACGDPCAADANGDGALTPADFSAWVNAYNNHLSACDQNADGTCTSADFTAWIANFNAGC
ncbi:MAG: FG-GAP repeat protein [Phycisphaerales bacterium]